VNRNGVTLSLDVALAPMSHGMTFPSSYIACCGARLLSEVSFTDCSFLPFIFIW
jgi:hypothetical protein